MRAGEIVTFAVACAVVAGSAGAQTPAPMPKLDAGDWFELDRSKDGETVMFIREAKPNGDTPRLWVRYESKTATAIGKDTYRSSAALEEFDCKTERVRPIQSTYYARNNLLGASYSPYLSQTWTYSRPGTLGYATLEAACMRDEGH